MTAFIGGSVLLIAASAVALAFGWVSSDETLIWASIGASGAAAILLSLAYNRSRAEVARAAALQPPREEEADEASPEAAVARDRGAEPVRASATGPEPTLATMTAVGGPGGSPARPGARLASKPAGRGDPDQDEVVVIPERQKYHRPDCRYAKARGAARMSRSAARKRAYSACGICKP